MEKLKVLNLYAGIGGNRRLWNNDLIEVTAVEIEKDIAEAYKHFFPNDTIIIGDAHQYLLEHFNEYDFIWSSPPCPTHSVLGKLGMNKYISATENNGSFEGTKKPEYPNMMLYQEIIFLKHFFKGKWVVENTKSYYNPLIKPYESGSHYFWSNFIITNINLESRAVSVNSINEKQQKTGFNLDLFSFRNIKDTHKKDKVLNNCVDSKLGLHVFNMAFKDKQQKLFNESA
jgi:DNA (cytosine-5)-methyltransferase 1